MKAFTVYMSNRAHYATFNVTAENEPAAVSKVQSHLKSENAAQEEYEMQFSGQGKPSVEDVWPLEDFVYHPDWAEESDHSDDLKMIDSGGNG